LALTAREIEVLTLLGRGNSKPEVARQLRLSPETVRDRLNNACLRMGVTGTVAAIMEALRRGLIDVGDGLVVVPKGAWQTAQELASDVVAGDQDAMRLRSRAHTVLATAAERAPGGAA
jgi:DNA-binding CsgD family transcriptional regulator